MRSQNISESYRKAPRVGQKKKRVSRNDRELKIDIREWPSDYTKMGKGITIVTVDVYGDNKGILIDGVPEMDEYIRKLLPERME